MKKEISGILVMVAKYIVQIPSDTHTNPLREKLDGLQMHITGKLSEFQHLQDLPAEITDFLRNMAKAAAIHREIVTVFKVLRTDFGGMIDRMVEHFETKENRASKCARLSRLYNEASIVYDTPLIYEQDINADGVLTRKLDDDGDFGDTVPDHLAADPVEDEGVAEGGALNYCGSDDIVAEYDDTQANSDGCLTMESDPHAIAVRSTLQRLTTFADLDDGFQSQFGSDGVPI